jgi:hypothetical protein
MIFPVWFVVGFADTFYDAFTYFVIFKDYPLISFILVALLFKVEVLLIDIFCWVVLFELDILN